MFDYIIIDAPPLGIFTDANVLINRADGALLVVRAGKTRYAMVDKLLEQLPRERMLGVVLNRADEELDSSSYYYQHVTTTAVAVKSGRKRGPACRVEKRRGRDRKLRASRLNCSYRPVAAR